MPEELVENIFIEDNSSSTDNFSGDDLLNGSHTTSTNLTQFDYNILQESYKEPTGSISGQVFVTVLIGVILLLIAFTAVGRRR